MDHNIGSIVNESYFMTVAKLDDSLGEDCQDRYF